MLRVENAALVGSETDAVAKEDDEEDLWEEDKESEEHEGDVRNNSAWAHRWFLNFGRVGSPGQVVAEKEIRCVLGPYLPPPSLTLTHALPQLCLQLYGVPVGTRAQQRVCLVVPSRVSIAPSSPLTISLLD